jgi:transposase-like protein
MQRTYSEEEKQAALKAYQEHGGAAAAKQTGIPAQTIRNWASQAGIAGPRKERTEAATKASRVDAAKLRAEFSSKSIALAARLLDRLSDDIDRDPTALSAKDKAVILGIVADKHRVIASMDKATQSHSDVDQWLEHITGMPVE